MTCWNAWHLSPGTCGNGMMWCWYAIKNQYSHTVKVQVYKPWKRTITRPHWSCNQMTKLKQQSTDDNQNTKDDLQITLRILLFQPVFIISSLLHTRDQSQYVQQQIDTIWLHTAEEGRVLQRSNPRFNSTAFDPYLRSHHTLHAFRRHWPFGSLVLKYRVDTLQSDFRRSFVIGRGIMNTQGNDINIWEREPRSALEEGQEVESYGKMRKEWVS